MSKTKHIIMLCSIVLLISSNTMSQFSGNNLMEIQIGNLPNSEPKDLITIYDQLDVKYRLKNFNFSTRLEQFHSSVNNSYEYIRINQFSASYRKRSLKIKAGNFYETLGKGLILRGYEIKNSVFEDRIYRSRQGFYKDILGFSGSYRYKFVNLKAVWGKTLNNQLPVGHPERRLDIVGGGEINFNIKNHTIGGIYLNHELNNVTNNLASVLFSGEILNSLSYYAEIAKGITDANSIASFSDDDRYGIYGSLNYFYSNIGISLEIKDYHNFFIGSGIADAPTLVKEQSYRLLNRSIHVAEFIDESGYQIEIFYNPGNDLFFTLNHSSAVNSFGTLKFNSYEYFIEANISKEKWQLKAFADFSRDDIKNEKNRITAGLYSSKYLRKNWSLNFEFEGQSIYRIDDNFYNFYFGLVSSKSTKFSAALLYELTTDPFLISDKSSIKTYPAINLTYQINTKHNLQLFAGERRGGPACTSGVCYEVLDFKGIELRYSLKL